MLRRTLVWLAPASAAATKSTLMPLEALTQIQLGITPPLSVQRSFLLEHCAAQLEQRGITEAKLMAMDGKLCAQLLKRAVLEQYLAVPFRVFSFDMEFTGPPAFTADGPTEDITEIGVYSPTRDETFSCLVKPASGRKQGPGVTELTGITDEMLASEGVPFIKAWSQFLDFVNRPEPGELPGAEQHILLLSHGGKLADVSLMKWALEKFDMSLPDSFIFGDTIHLIRDAHRRRPVTIDKHPPSWKLLDLVQWMKIPPTLPAHRAGNDAKMTWDALYHTLLRYGDDDMSPREQLIPRFFDEEARVRMERRQFRHGGSALSDPEDSYLAVDAAPTTASRTISSLRSVSPNEVGDAPADDNPLDLDLDDIFDAPTSSPGASREKQHTRGEAPAADPFFLHGEEGSPAADISRRKPAAAADEVEEVDLEAESFGDASGTVSDQPRGVDPSAKPKRRKKASASKKVKASAKKKKQNRSSSTEQPIEEEFIC